MAFPYHHAFTGDQVHTPYAWTPADQAAREAITIASGDVYKVALQQDDNSAWTAIATGSGASKWQRIGVNSNVVIAGPTAQRTYTFPDSDATVFTDKTKTDALQAATFATDSGAADAYVVTLAPAITAYTTGVRYRFKATNPNTGASTVNFNSLGTKSIKKKVDGTATALAANDIRANQWCDLIYDGTDMILVSPLGNTATGTGSGGGADFLTVQVFS